MRNKILASLGILSVCVAVALANSPQFFSLTPNATNVQANSTNATVGTIFPIATPQGYSTITFSGDTQAASSSGNIICEVSRATGADGTTNAFETPATMPSTTGIRLTMTPSGAGSWCSGDTINLYGVKYLRINRIMNQTGGPLSNIVVTVGIQSGSAAR